MSDLAKSPEKSNVDITFKQRQITRVFEPLDDEILLMIASAKFNFTTCKTDEKTLNLTLAYIEDTKKMLTALKARMNLIQEITS
jgi:hypothetical protein